MQNSLLPSEQLIETLVGMKYTPFALMNHDGLLIEASEGFRNLLPEQVKHLPDLDLSIFFLQPRFKQFSDLPENRYSGLFTIGAYSGRTETVSGTIYSDDEYICFLGEFDFEEACQHSDKFSSLIMELSESQRQLVRANTKLKSFEQEAVKLSLTDPLTGLGNRRRLEQALDVEIYRSVRNQRPLSLMMIDLDHFKRINDHYGHDVGDYVLKACAKGISQCIRKFDYAVRFGGDEFIILMPEIVGKPAFEAAERVRLKLAQIRFDSYPFTMTASIGVSSLVSNDSSETFLRRADVAMYEAKKNQRNQVQMSG